MNTQDLLSDGAIDSKRYEQASPRVVHLLKQGVRRQRPTYASSLGTMIRDEFDADPDSMVKIWKVTARRTFALAFGLPEWGRIVGLSVREALWPALLSTAIVNVIKTPGDRYTPDAILTTEVSRYAKRVRAQLRRLDPDFVLCGGTFDVLHSQILHSTGEATLTTLCGGRYLCHGRTIFVDCYHPAHRLPHHVEYAFFRAALGEIAAVKGTRAA